MRNLGNFRISGSSLGNVKEGTEGGGEEGRLSRRPRTWQLVKYAYSVKRAGAGAKTEGEPREEGISIGQSSSIIPRLTI